MLVLSHVKQSIDALAFSPDGTHLATGGTSDRAGVQVWSWVTQTRTTEDTNFRRAVYNLWWTADTRLVVGTRGFGIDILRRDSTEHWTVLRRHDAVYSGVTPAGHAWGRVRPAAATENYLYQVQIETDGATREMWSVPIGRTGWSHFVAVLGGGRLLSIEKEHDGDYRARIRMLIRSSAAGDVLEPVTYPYLAIGPVAVAPDGDSFWIANHGSIVRRPTDDPNRMTDLIQNDTRQHFTALAFSPDGRYLAAASNDQTVKFYDPETGHLAKSFTWDIGRMRSVAFSPDGLVAAAGSDTGKVIVWDVDG